MKWRLKPSNSPQVRCLPFFVTHTGGARQSEARGPGNLAVRARYGSSCCSMPDGDGRRQSAAFLKNAHRLDIEVD